MNNTPSNKFLLLVLVVLVSFFFSLSQGSGGIGIQELYLSVFSNAGNAEAQTILIDFRLPKSIAAMCCGISLSICGLMMQTLFRNPLAGPYILGINSGANLFVSVFILGTTNLGMELSGFLRNLGVPTFGILGSVITLTIILIFSIRIKNTNTLLLIGIMLGFLYSATQGILEFFSNPEDLKKFTLWSMGNFSHISWNELMIFVPMSILLLFLSILFVKGMDNFLLGEEYAKASGINLLKVRWIILLITGVLSGLTVAFCGPIAFVGLIIPHLARIIFKTSRHVILLPASALLGCFLLLICDGLGSLFTENFTIPINIITSLLGAPFTIWLLMRKNNQFH